jgi:hypothetical protein
LQLVLLLGASGVGAHHHVLACSSAASSQPSLFLHQFGVGKHQARSESSQVKKESVSSRVDSVLNFWLVHLLYVSLD